MARPGLYLHVPFCARICPYCDFAVLVGDAGRRERFVESLIAEIRSWAGDPAFRGLDTIYFGGGTPSILETEKLAGILEVIDATFGPDAESRIFLEANPEDVTRERAEGWKALGVRTVSLGVQSFDSSELEFLGRLHTPAEARRSVEIARDVGFETVSVDLIYGLPDQSGRSWRRNLEHALELGSHHLSCYQLTVHRKTVFGVRKARGELAEMPEADQADLFLLTHATLNEAGLQGYEVSNFARSPEHRSSHNRKYWDHTPYLGLGPSAHSYAAGRRWWNERGLTAWRRRVDAEGRGVAGSEELASGDLALESLMLGFRTYDGVDLIELRERHGIDLRARNAATLERLVGEELLVDEGDVLRPTLRGLAMADGLARGFDL